MVKYGMTNEESFQSLSDESISDLSENKKEKAKQSLKPENCEIKKMVRSGGR